MGETGTDQRIDARVDARGLRCPMPVLKARRELAAMTPGARLEVLATDPNSATDMADFCAAAGHTLQAAEELPESESLAGQPALRFVIVRRTD
jgi:tRNA 2-thiouridine synthesizing protein A